MTGNSNEKFVSLLHDLTYEAANMCVQCGYCLPACPTYESMGKESQSPRGRINLVKMAAEGKIDLQKDLAEPMDLCLGCRACETACPVGVPYGEIYEGARKVIALQEKEANQKREPAAKMREHVLNHVFPRQKRLRLLGNVAWLYQKTSVNKAVQKLKLVHKASEPMGQFEKVLPRVESPLKRYKFGDVFPARGEKKATVAFFAGCVMDAMMSKINRLTIELLQSVGCEVIIPKGQNCCGALHAHQGMIDEAKELAKANIEAFEETEADYFINNAGGCGAMLREYDKHFKGDREWEERARRFVEKSRDITEVLAAFGPLPFQKEWNGIITYQDSCHLRNVQGVVDEPRLLLQSVPGAEYVEMKGSDRCCASGGIYNLIHFDESMKILDDKMENAKETKAQTIVTANPGCLLQMKLGVERSGLENARALHIVEVMAEACGIS
jgi:glycolate oxidase iron-sulfur subunit